MRILSFSILVALAVGCGLMGLSADVALADTDPDAANETEYDHVMWIIDRYAPEDAPTAAVEQVEAWATDERLAELDEGERQLIVDWLEAATDDESGPTIDARHCERLIDSKTCLTDWTYEDHTFTLTVMATENTTITYAEVADWDEGSGHYRTGTIDVVAGNTTTAVTTIEGRNSGVSLSFATQLSQDENRGSYISSGSAAKDPFRHFGGASGLFSGVGMTVVLAALGAGIVVRQEEKGVVER